MSLTDPLSQVLLALVVVILVGLVLGRALSYLGQPAVIAEILAGIALGPSLLGPRLSGMLLPAPAVPLLEAIAQLGIVVYLFTVGLELEGLGRRTKALVSVSLGSLLIPFALGLALAYPLHTRLAGTGATPGNFALFFGISLSITAFPVLARFLSDRGLLKTEIGTLSLTGAAIGDVVAWCALAFVVGGTGLKVLAGAAVYLLVMLALIRPLVQRRVARWEGEALTPVRVALLLAGLLLSALATQLLGIHALSGAFLWGLVVASPGTAIQTLRRQLQPVVQALLLPAFFALTGMRARLDLLVGWDAWLICLLIIFVATLGKVGGTFLSARLVGVSSRDAGVLGVLMNTRGLIELIVLNIGLEAKIISPTLFAILVVMALVTTMMTAPALQWLKPWQPQRG